MSEPTIDPPAEPPLTLPNGRKINGNSVRWSSLEWDFIRSHLLTEGKTAAWMVEQFQANFNRYVCATVFEKLFQREQERRRNVLQEQEEIRQQELTARDFSAIEGGPEAVTKVALTRLGLRINREIKKPKEWTRRELLAALKVLQAERESDRDDRRLKLLEEKASAYDRAQAAMTEAKGSGGITPETLAKVEQELKLR